jgi:hypothetical protein
MSVTSARITAACATAMMVSFAPHASVVRAQVQPGPSQPITVVTATDLDLDTVPDIIVTRTLTYQGSRVITTVSSTDGSTTVDANGVVDSVQTTTFTYGQGGQAVLEHTEIDSNNDGVVDLRRVVTNTYDAGNRLIMRLAEIFDASDIKTAEDLQTNTYTSRGDLLSQHWTFDFGFDGTINREQNIANTYDGAGRLIQTITTIDENSDGTVDVETMTTIERDANGHPIVQTTEIDDPAGGGIEQVRESTDFVFQGRDLLALSSSYDAAPLGSLEWTSLTSHTFGNRPGEILERVQAIDIGDNGSVDNTLTATFSYDQQGNLLQSVTEIDSDADGFANQTVTLTFTY